jgi:hypothetical protein
MADEYTIPDLLFVKAAAIVFSVQIVLFTENDLRFDISPCNAFRRVFLFAGNGAKHYNWGRVALPDDAQVDAAHEWTFDAPELRATAAHVPSPQAFSNGLDISDDKLRLMHAAHNAYNGHPGVEATVRQLWAMGHKWRRMTAHVTQFIKRCPTCCSSRSRLAHAPVSAATVRLHARPLRRWHIDQTGTMGDCLFTGFKLLIVFICEVTQFTVLYGSRFGTALETAIALINLMGWLGLAESIHSDGGPENDNYIWHQVTQMTGIKHTISLPNIPSSNPIAERNIGTAKRFIRALTVDLDKHSAWGLLLPIAQKGLNDLHRKDLLWKSPNDIVFASLADQSSFVIPTFYTRHQREGDLVDANQYHISANFAHRAACFQQLMCNRIRDIHARAFEASARSNPTTSSDLLVGQLVLISWPRDKPPTPTHPLKRGPYKVTNISANTVDLVHLYSPPPADQQPSVTWSKHANVFLYTHDATPTRAPLDPAASQSSTGVHGRNIDCVLSHSPLAENLRPQEVSRHHVSAQLYCCRLFSALSTKLPPTQAVVQSFTYDKIAHTHAFDSYALSQRQLTGHTPTACMPSNWSPHAVPQSGRPSHPPLPLHEHPFPPNDDEGEHSQ